ncbi:MAG TPA: hypothetical protein VEW03_06915 [Longimicrobiaceae bacterium]|nr:hypothetical protein [Longimicrobiaceae bacterium]
MPRPIPRPPKKPNDLGPALKTAFMFRWNLLSFLGAVGAAVLSGHPDLLLPFIGAVEIAYLGGMVSFPKFRRAVARQAAAPTPEAAGRASTAVASLISGLPQESRTRFARLRSRCLEMRQIALGVRGRDAAHPQGETTIQTPALDRLLWVFLRLLSSQHALQRFLETTSEAELQKRTAELKQRLETVTAAGDDRLMRSLTDSVAVAELRLENHGKAKANAEFVHIELDRIEAKIQALTEMSINRQDPDFLSSQVDAAAESMTHTESAITELQTITGMVDELEEPPAILDPSFGERSTDVA